MSLGLFVFGIAIGLCRGLLGIGGGVLLVPGLVLLFGFSQQEAKRDQLAAHAFIAECLVFSIS